MVQTFNEILYIRTIPELSKNEIWKLVRNASGDEERIIYLVDLLKIGDFSAKEELTKLMLESSDTNIRKLSCQIFCCVAIHSDIKILRDYLEQIQKNEDEDELEDELEDFVSFSIYTLSPNVISLLLDLLDTWEGEIESSLQVSLDSFFPGLESDDENSLKEIRDFYTRKREEYNSFYIYEGSPAFPGNWTKVLLERAATARYYGETLNQTSIPTLLSLWSGIDCPAYFMTKIDDDMFGKLLNYAKQMASTKWEKGSKYFFGHKITD